MASPKNYVLWLREQWFRPRKLLELTPPKSLASYQGTANSDSPV